MRYFNTAGPIKPAMHYHLDPLSRFDLDEVLLLIAQGKYFVLHAPRQTGKTSSLLALMTHLNQAEDYHALYVNVEAAQAMREDVASALDVILTNLADNAQLYLQDDFLRQFHASATAKIANNLLQSALNAWCRQLSKPLVLLIDEIDSLIGDTLVSVLRQLRSGYPNRPQAFPLSAVLCGVRDVRDYRIHSSRSQEIITGGSAFNIKAVSLRMGNFTQDDITQLYQQHTAETGQIFGDGVLDLVWQYTQGQPWLVNALAYEVCFNMKANRDRSISISPTMVIQAKENLILRRETHLDQLADKLKETRVQRVMKPILTGQDNPSDLPSDDVWYVRDLGLIKDSDQLEIANAIYQEIIPRELTYTTQLTISHKPTWYYTETGLLDMSKLLAAFQDFFRQHAESWVERFEYKEAGPQLLLQAFLQRIVNGGGRIEREYGLGRGRTDLLVIWPHSQGEQRIVIELKLQRGALENTIQQGLPQTWAYADRCQADQAHLVIFNRAENLAWKQKIFSQEAFYQAKKIMVWGM